MSVYMHDWSETASVPYGVPSEDGMLQDFRIDKTALDGMKVLVASYTYEDYSGYAFVLLRKGDQLFEVNGSHCSCYGLEGQWKPEAVTKEALLHRATKGTLAYNNPGLDEAVIAALKGKRVK